MKLDGVDIESSEHLETLIADLPEESKIALRLIWQDENGSL